MQYIYQPDEAVLFEQDICIKGNGSTSHLILTNYNIVISGTAKRAFKKEEPFTETYPVNEIKIYNDEPQVIHKSNCITIYFINGQLEFSFDNYANTIKFVNKIRELLTGKTAAERGASKVKKTIDLIDDTLGIDTVGTISKAVENGVGNTIIGGVKSYKGGFKALSNITSAANSIIKNPNSAQPNAKIQDNDSYMQKAEEVKKLNELVEMGLITKEEFDKKKKELLDL